MNIHINTYNKAVSAGASRVISWSYKPALWSAAELAGDTVSVAAKGVLQCVAVCCSVLQCAAECCCVGMCCSVLQCAVVCCRICG